jgi:hypothetical protein
MDKDVKQVIVKKQSQASKKRITPTPLPLSTDIGHNNNKTRLHVAETLTGARAFQDIRSSSHLVFNDRQDGKVSDSERLERLLSGTVNTPVTQINQDSNSTSNNTTANESVDSKNDTSNPNEISHRQLLHDILSHLDHVNLKDYHIDSTDYWREVGISLTHSVISSKVHIVEAVRLIMRTAQYLCLCSSLALESFFQASVSGLSMIIRRLGTFIITKILSCRHLLEDSIITDLEACNDDFNSKDALDSLNLKWRSDKFDRLSRDEVDKNDLKSKV